MIEIKAGHPTAPKELHDHVAKIGGMNPLGEPMYRLVWGASRLDLVVGMFCDFDDDGTLLRRTLDRRLETKYPETDRWHMEVWLSPEAYTGCSPDEWRKRTSLENGLPVTPAPYPERGEYESFVCCETPKGEYAEPSSSWVERAIELHRAARNIERSARVAKRQAKTKAMRADIDRQKDDLIDDRIQRAFWGRPFVQFDSTAAIAAERPIS